MKKPQEGITPRTSLKNKVSGTAGPPSEMVMRRVERRVEVMGDEFASIAEGYVQNMQALLRGTSPHEAPLDKTLKALHSVAFDVRGQSGSFGFPLVTKIATGLCRFLESIEGVSELDEDARVICQGYVNAIADILRHARKGHGEELDQKVAESLNMAAKIYCQKREITLIQ